MKVIEKKGNGRAQNARNIPQPSSAYSIDSPLILFDLLTCQANQPSQLFLAHPQKGPSQANTIANSRIEFPKVFFKFCH